MKIANRFQYNCQGGIFWLYLLDLFEMSQHIIYIQTLKFNFIVKLVFLMIYTKQQHVTIILLPHCTGFYRFWCPNQFRISCSLYIRCISIHLKIIVSPLRILGDSFIKRTHVHLLICDEIRPLISRPSNLVIAQWFCWAWPKIFMGVSNFWTGTSSSI